MRTHVRLAAAATAAATAATLCLTVAGATAAPQDPGNPAQRALEAVRSHAAASHFGAGQALKTTHTITDGNGRTHVRMDRSYKGPKSLAATSSYTRADRVPGRVSVRPCDRDCG